MRFYCNSKAYKYYQEYIESLLQMNSGDLLVLYNVNEQINISDDNITNIFVEIIPNYNIINASSNIVNIILLNTEQMTRKLIYDRMIQIIYNYENTTDDKIKFSICDYSIQNIEIIKKLTNKIQVHHLPYLFNVKEQKNIQSLIKNKNNTYDVSVCGLQSQHRNIIHKQIYKKKIQIKNIVGWDDQRDLEIANSKILLNIHFDNDYTIYESIRCDRWIFAGHMVISEDTCNNDLLDVKDVIIFSKYGDISDCIKNILQNYGQYQSQMNNNKHKIKDIIRNRYNIYLSFRKIFNN